MSAASSDTKSSKRPGQSGTPVMVRLQPDLLTLLDAWIGEQHDQPSRPEAIRRIVARMLDDNPEWTEKDFARARLASELHDAAKVKAVVRDATKSESR